MQDSRMDFPDLPVLLAQDLDKYFQHFVLTYQYRLYTFILRQTGNAQDAEDIVQEAFLRSYFALKVYQRERICQLVLRPWLYKIALNIFYSEARKPVPLNISLDRSEEGPHVTIEDDLHWQPENKLQEQEEIQELEQAVRYLPATYRTAVNCYYFEYLSYQEIAELLNIPIGTVKTHLFRGIRMLRAKFKELHDEVRNI